MDHSENIAQFSAITGIDTEQARFFVESADGNIQAALSTFYETVGTAIPAASADLTVAGDHQRPHPPAGAGPLSGPPSSANTLNGQSAESLPEAWRKADGGALVGGRVAPQSSNIAGLGSTSRSIPPRSGPARIATLKDLSLGAGGIGGDDTDDDGRHRPSSPSSGDSRDLPDLYAGGGRSGLNVQDPNQQRSNQAKGIVGDILKQANQGGPVSELTSRPSIPKFFGGAAHTLGGNEDSPSQMLAVSQDRATSMSMPGGYRDVDDQDVQDEEVERQLTFWKDGFSIEDGPLLSYEDPKNKEVLEVINSGRAPLDLLKVKFDQRVTMRVQNRIRENYVPPPPKPMAPFSGSGQRLGSPTAVAIGAGPSSSTTARSQAASTATTGGTIFEVDSTQPVTSVQIRLVDGTRMLIRCNHTHTVGDIRRQIQASNPEYASQSFALQTTFPSRELKDDDQTIQEAGLAGSVVVQRYI